MLPTFTRLNFVRPCLIATAVLCVSVLPASAQTEVLDNSAVVQLVTAKVPKALILAKIQSTPTKFDVTPSGLVNLNENKVAREIMEAMMTAQDSKLSQNANSETLTNEGVIQMVAGRLPSAVIQKKIKTTPSAFDVTAAGLITLNENKVGQDLVKLMMTAAATRSTVKH